MKLCSQFLTHLAPGVAEPPESSELEALLERLAAEARAAWPTVAVSTEDFVGYVAERLPAGQDVLASLARLQAGDLFLACGCTHGDPAALAAFDLRFVSRLASYLGRSESLPAFTDEVKQAVRVRLLVSEEGLAPRIASYRGQGPLAVWLRLAAVRLAVNLRKSERRDVGNDEDIARLQTAAADPELEFFKEHYREELRRAVEGALLALPVRDANLLRLFFFERLSIETIAAMHNVSTRTVHRWIADVRERIVAETRRLLNERCRIPAAQFDSVVGLLGSQIEISMRRLLEKPSV